MAKSYSADRPESEEVQLRIMDEHVTMTRWTEYQFASDFLTPTDGWSFTVSDEDLPAKQRDALKVGARVRLTVNNAPLCDGHIDTITIGASRGGGQTWHIAGRDRIALAVDAVADPTLQFKDGVTLEEVLRQLFEPFGWVDPDAHFAIDNTANRNALTGGIRGTPTGKGKKHLPLKSFIAHQLKPHNHEGVYDFAKRIATRFGLWIWCSNDGEKIIVSKPDFDQEPTYQIRRTFSGDGNVEDGSVKYDYTDQPAILIADGFSGGGEFGKGKIKSYVLNPYFGVDENGFELDEVARVRKRHPDANQVLMTTQPFTRRSVNVPPRIVFLHDDESKTQEQLDNFVRREMSLLIRKSLTADYVVEGHGQLLNDIFIPWETDTVVDVNDEVTGLKERMYVLGVHYSKSRGSGTRTQLHLVRLNSIQF